MDVKIKTWLEDILKAITEIEGFLPEEKNFFVFQKDLKTKRAIERNLEIIGEAVSRILKIQSDFHLKNSRKIVDSRNRIIHGYDTVSEEIIWAIVVRDLPKLKNQTTQLLAQK
ncbi:MAG: HepT-like ribonuclease domain-containing protein [Algoriphagus sp.]